MASITVVIPTFDSSRTIGRCLASVNNQTSQCEVILVDNCSRDGTIEIARRNGATVIRRAANRSEARNIGFKQSSSVAVLFIDSDMILPPTLIEECEQALVSHDALLIPEISIGIGYWATCKSMERRTYIGTRVLEAARCFRRERLSPLGGFDPSLEAGEDWDLQQRAELAGLSFGRVDSKIIHDEGRLRLATILKKKYFYGKTIGRYLRKNHTISIRQLNPITRIITPSLKVAVKNPSYGIGVFVIKSLEFTVAGLGHISVSIRR